MKPTLFILAAGMGSRYGGLKQLDGVGPSGETIMDYSVYDALKAGFGKIVFVIRKDFEVEFRKVVLKKYEDKIPCEICFQALESLPEGFTVPQGRTKPWGTNHAVMMAKDLIHEPFAVINADDYYGQESFRVIADFLKSVEGKQNEYCMVGYRVQNTLSENGTVNRGVCQKDENDLLTDVVECINIEQVGDKILYKNEAGEDVDIPLNTPVSMNMWGFTPDYFNYSNEAFIAFLNEFGKEMKKEIYIPTVVDGLIKAGKATCKVLDTPSHWFGVTYAEDRPQVVMKLNELVKNGTYPAKLF